ncbi:MAG: hypothetical protein COU46_00940 [Candidatus Niyogibacteria bacterium CG10_big_fil_rev_8_21_14_0_10_42_19]|uniref:Uncharacterized protein n=1 Tax=Candidatus Niyogibacteria bacterium CG10_big_fil_rev_8_21_14_0_10_42_19 TaxID=1974725 RepID=A0A2H0TG88_9BACT|nr:MAG: hypothetical protein COU46_00940 [Candidatus Niyogibacteria bacterium CG10_big_fil_rev_8_21_14_0_10_42_19]
MERVKVFHVYTNDCNLGNPEIARNDMINNGLEASINAWLEKMGDGITITEILQSSYGYRGSHTIVSIFYESNPQKDTTP